MPELAFVTFAFGVAQLPDPAILKDREHRHENQGRGHEPGDTRRTAERQTHEEKCNTRDFRQIRQILAFTKLTISLPTVND